MERGARGVLVGCTDWTQSGEALGHMGPPRLVQSGKPRPRAALSRCDTYVYEFALEKPQGLAAAEKSVAKWRSWRAGRDGLAETAAGFLKLDHKSREARGITRWFEQSSSTGPCGPASWDIQPRARASINACPLVPMRLPLLLHVRASHLHPPAAHHPTRLKKLLQARRLIQATKAH